MEVSKLSNLGTVVAYIYPVIWAGTAFFGMLWFSLYSNRKKRFSFTLLVGAILAQIGRGLLLRT